MEPDDEPFKPEEFFDIEKLFVPAEVSISKESS